jgi:hypothetical protein
VKIAATGKRRQCDRYLNREKGSARWTLQSAGLNKGDYYLGRYLKDCERLDIAPDCVVQ